MITSPISELVNLPTRFVGCECCNRDILTEVPFLVYDNFNSCWLGFDEKQQVIQKSESKDIEPFQEWEEANNFVLAYLEKFQVDISDLEFVDHLQEQPNS
jgi:hypothetical protein